MMGDEKASSEDELEDDDLEDEFDVDDGPAEDVLSEEEDKKEPSPPRRKAGFFARGLRSLISLAVKKKKGDGDDSDESDYSYESDEDASTEEDIYVDPLRCWGRFFVTDTIKHRTSIRRTCTLNSGAMNDSDNYGGQGECDILQRGPNWYLRFRRFEMTNVKESDVYVYLSKLSVSAEAPNIEKKGKGHKLFFECGVKGCIRGDGCGAEFEQLLPGTDENLKWNGFVLAKPRARQPNTADPLVFCFGNFKQYKRNWQEKEELKNEINAVQKEFKGANKMYAAITKQRKKGIFVGIDQNNARQAAEEAFKACGFSADDELEPMEFQTTLRHLNLHFTQAKTQPLFRVGDLDGNGDMDFKEFTFVVMLMSRLAPIKRVCLWEWFFMFSKLNAGYLDYVEFYMCMAAMGNKFVSEDRAFKLFNKMHKYGKFHVNYEEFKDMWARVVKKGGNLKAECKAAGKRSVKLPTTDTLVQAIQDEDDNDAKNFEQAKLGAFMAQKAKRLAQSEADADRRHQRLDEVRSKRKEIAVNNRKEKYEDERQTKMADEQGAKESALRMKVYNQGEARKQAERDHLGARIRSKRAREKARREREGMDILDLAGRGLYHLPEECYQGAQAQADLTYVTYINLSHNKLLDLPNLVLLWLSDSQKLDVSHNKLKYVPTELGMMGKLRVLNLSFNQLSTLPDELGNLEMLELLIIANNSIVTLPDGIGKLKRLRRLDMQNNHLQALPKSIGNLALLSSFRADVNRLQSIPEGFAQLVSLEQLRLSQNSLNKLPKDIGRLTTLELLEVNANMLTSLPETFGGLTSLRVLRVSQNKLVELPPGFCNCTRLLDFDAAHNKLMALPTDFGRLRDLQALNVAHNRLRTLPASIGFLAQLVRLVARDNLLEQLPKEVGSLKALCELDLGFNRLSKSLPVGMGMLFNLQVLNLSHNRLQTLPPNIGTLRMLTQLDVAHNCLKHLPESIGRLTQLQTLLLSTNTISRVPFSIGKMGSLAHLDLSANRLRLLPRQISALRSLRNLGLYNNQLEALPVEFGQIIPSLSAFDCGRNPLSAYPAKWSGSAEGRISGYTNAEIVDMLVMMAQVYPCLMSVWDAQFEANNGHIRDSDFLAAAQKQMGHEWRKQYEKIGRQFLRICQVQGDYPVYHQLLPDEENRRMQKRTIVKRVAKRHVSESRRVRNEMLAKQRICYAVPSDQKCFDSLNRQEKALKRLEVDKELLWQDELDGLHMVANSKRMKQDLSRAFLRQRKQAENKEELQRIRIRMAEITKVRDHRLLMRSKEQEAIRRKETDAEFIKQRADFEGQLGLVSKDLHTLHETMAKKANLFASSRVRQKAQAREAGLVAKKKRLQNEYSSLIMQMQDNEEWFSENSKFEIIEEAHERFQYQRVIAGITGFQMMTRESSSYLPGI